MKKIRFVTSRRRLKTIHVLDWLMREYISLTLEHKLLKRLSVVILLQNIEG